MTIDTDSVNVVIPAPAFALLALIWSVRICVIMLLL